MIINVKQMNGQTLEISMDNSARVAELKLKLKEMLSVEVDRQRLIMNGRVLQNDVDLLQELSSGNDSLVLHLVVRPENFVPPSTQSNTPHTATTNNSTSAPRQQLPPQFQQVGNVIVGSVTLQDGDAESFIANSLSSILGQFSGGTSRPINISSLLGSTSHLNILNNNSSNNRNDLSPQDTQSESKNEVAPPAPAPSSIRDTSVTRSKQINYTIIKQMDYSIEIVM